MFIPTKSAKRGGPSVETMCFTGSPLLFCPAKNNARKELLSMVAHRKMRAFPKENRIAYKGE